MRKFNPLPQVVIVGRSNVGKSTLFNKIVEKNQALALAQAGTTRDRLEASVNWQGKNFNLVDTGGLDLDKNDFYRGEIIKQSLVAQTKAKVLILLVDIRVGLLPGDKKIARDLVKLKKPVLLAVNKCDDKRKKDEAVIFTPLGFPFYPVSARNGTGIGDLLDAITARLTDNLEIDPEAKLTLALIGKPNVGKSSLLNGLYGEERMIVSHRPHTTRDAQDVLVQYTPESNNPERQNVLFKIIDTAGIRRRIDDEEIEDLSVAKSLAAIKKADVAALVLDISQKLTSQDKRLGKEISSSHKGLFLVANKWDLIPDKDPGTVDKYKKYLHYNFPHLTWSPIIFVSALQKQRLSKILDLAWDIYLNLNKVITEENLDRFLKKAIARRRPTIGKGAARPQILNLKQTRTNPLSFLVEITARTNLASYYLNYLANSLRKEFGLAGVPVRIIVKEATGKQQNL